MSKKSLADHLAEWDKLAATAANNAKDLAAFLKFVELLRMATAEAREAKQRQVTLRAAAQQASRDLENALAKARDYEARIHQGILGTYGRKSEKLVEFGLSPRRPTGPRKRKSPQPETSGEAPETTSPASRKPSRRRKS
jgi:hypothetical protein